MAEPRRKQTPVLRLVRAPRPADPATVDCLRTLLREAEAGELVGMAFVARYRGRVWDRGACGEADADSVWTLGMLQAYAVELANRVNDA